MDTEQRIAALEARLCLADRARLALFPASNDARTITGQSLSVDAGFPLR
jgi:NAD(P)-dependent dehydrogenase (short-subunit alcohol dehydrogenase family)